MKSIAYAVLPIAAAAFVSAPMQKTRGCAVMAQSKALPFLTAPSKLDGKLVGDNGFDPMGISDQVADLKYVRASELKHGRVAMLAFLGWIVQHFVHLPGEMYSEVNPIKAISKVPLASHLQIFLFIAALEMSTIDTTYTSQEPWNYGFDPLGFTKGKSPEQIRDLELKELKNGRVAMIAIIGLIVQTLVTGKSLGA